MKESNKVPFCPYCKTIIKKVILLTEREFTGYEYMETEITIKEVDESDWENGDDNDAKITTSVECGNCKEKITDIIVETIGESLISDYIIDDNINLIRRFLRKGNKTRDEVMVELI